MSCLMLLKNFIDEFDDRWDYERPPKWESYKVAKKLIEEANE